MKSFHHLRFARPWLHSLLIGAALLLGACALQPTPVPSHGGAAATPAPVAAASPAVPLPAAAIADTRSPAATTAIRLPDGTVCDFAGRGATLAFNGKRLNYTCGSPEVGLLDGPKLEGSVLTLERATIGRNDAGFFLRDAYTLTLELAGVDLADGTRCLSAGRGATLAFDGKRLNYTCGGAEVGLLGDLMYSDGVWTAERATITRGTNGFTLAGSAPAPVKTLVTAVSPAAAAFNEAALKNARYELPDIGAFQLRDGGYEHKYGPGATQVNRVTFQRAVFGDLSGDALPDAAVILAVNTGGSGVFTYLAAVSNINGWPAQQGVEMIGDRVRVESIAITGRQITLDLLAFSPNDPLCCPSQPVVRTYAVEALRLKVVSEAKGTPLARPTPSAALPPTPAPALLAARFHPATNRCEPQPAFVQTNLGWQSSIALPDGKSGVGFKAGQEIVLSLRSKLAGASDAFSAQAVVIAPDGSFTTAAATVQGNIFAQVVYPTAFRGAKPLASGDYTVIWQTAAGPVVCWGFKVE